MQESRNTTNTNPSSPPTPHTHPPTSQQAKKGDRCEVQVIQFIIGMCKVQSGRGYICEGLEIMQTLCSDGSKFPYKPAAHYWLALSFEKIFW